MEVLLWGFTSLFIIQRESSLSFIVVTLLSGIILWMVVWRSQYEITVNLLEELWNQNMMNLFASPLKLREWLAGVFILGILSILVSAGFATLVAFLVYKANIFSLGFYLIPFLISLILTGWGTGLIIASLILRFGRRIQTLAWTGVAIITPFSGVYYPISVLPGWAQKVAVFLPTSYIFEGMRSVILEGVFSYEDLLKSFLLNFILLGFGLSLFLRMFEKSKELGLARLD
jgi:ABC-2 type transport system permease protein